MSLSQDRDGPFKSKMLVPKRACAAIQRLQCGSGRQIENYTVLNSKLIFINLVWY
jgi:hypothetical protein